MEAAVGLALAQLARFDFAVPPTSSIRSAVDGARIFEGKGQCARKCHPPLRVPHQDPMAPERTAPSLLGLLDNHPLPGGQLSDEETT